LSQISNYLHLRHLHWLAPFPLFHLSHLYRRHSHHQSPPTSDENHRHAVRSSTGQKRATKIMLSDLRMPSFFSDATVAKSDKRQRRRQTLRRRNNGRPIYRRRSASSGRALLRTSVRSGKIVRRRKRKSTNSYTPTTSIGRSGPRRRNRRGSTMRPIRRATFPSCSRCLLLPVVMVARHQRPHHHWATNRYNFPTSTCLLAQLRPH